MPIISTEQFNTKIEEMQIKCSYKYVLLYILLKEKDENDVVKYDKVVDRFQDFFELRERLNLDVEKLDSQCNPLSNIKRTISTPMDIFVRDNLIEVYDDEIKILFEYDITSLGLVENKLREYFVNRIADEPENFKNFFENWI